MRKLLVALTASATLLLGGVATAAPALAGPTAPAANPRVTTTHKAHVGVKAPKGKPTEARSGSNLLKPNVIVSCGVNPCYRYAVGSQNPSAADGATIDAVVEKPTLLVSDYHSLFEMALSDTTNNNTIELGWNVDPVVNGDSNPHLFTFIWVNGVPQCYNGCPSGGTPGAQFLDAAGCTPWCAGDNLASFIGTSHTFQIRHYSTGTAGWWISVDGVFRGVWPDTSFSTGTVSTTINHVQMFGELALANNPSESDMGSSVLASTTAGSLAQNYTLINSVSSPSLTLSTPAGQFEPTRWNWASVSATSFRYGGPGGNEDIQSCSGVGAQSTFGFGSAPYNGGYGTVCLYANTSSGVPVTPVYNKDASVARNVCFPNLGTGDGQTTTGIKVMVNTSYVKWFWFRDANCAGANTLLDYGQAVLPAGWGTPTALVHASLMRTSTLNSH